MIDSIDPQSAYDSQFNKDSIERQRVTSQALCNHFCGAKEHGFPMENEHFVVARLLKQL